MACVAGSGATSAGAMYARLLYTVSSLASAALFICFWGLDHAILKINLRRLGVYARHLACGLHKVLPPLLGSGEVFAGGAEAVGRCVWEVHRLLV
jgi:hypothetical protein